MSGKRCYKENGGGSFGYSSVSKQKTIRTFLCKNILKLFWECDCVGYGHDYIHTYIHILLQLPKRVLQLQGY